MRALGLLVVLAAGCAGDPFSASVAVADSGSSEAAPTQDSGGQQEAASEPDAPAVVPEASDDVVTMPDVGADAPVMTEAGDPIDARDDCPNACRAGMCGVQKDSCGGLSDCGFCTDQMCAPQTTDTCISGYCCDMRTLQCSRLTITSPGIPSGAMDKWSPDPIPCSAYYGNGGWMLPADLVCITLQGQLATVSQQTTWLCPASASFLAMCQKQPNFPFYNCPLR